MEGDHAVKIFADGKRLISIHALRVEGDVYAAAHRDESPISIHALRVEGDEDERNEKRAARISIHALRVEGDRIQQGSGL